MKIFIAVYLTIFSIASGQTQSYVDAEGNTHLWGTTALDDFKSEPYSIWYKENAEEYQAQLNSDHAEIFKDLSVKIFIGTWCGDTKFLFPKFVKSWKQMGLSEEQLSIIGLHHEGELYKQGPNKESEGLDIHRVPTFIFYKNEEEIGRIVERTVYDLETDMKLIAEAHPYKHRYQGVSIVSELMASNIDSLESESFLKLVNKKSRRELSGASELNAYAYILLFSGALEEAKFVFKLNRDLFPFYPYAHYGYGKALFVSEEYEEAKKQFLEAVRLKPEFDKAFNYLYEIGEKVKFVSKS